MLARLETAQFQQFIGNAGFNALKLLALRMEAIVEVREDVIAQIRKQNDRIADLERQRPAGASAADRTELKHGRPAVATDSFFTVTRSSVPGTLQRRDLATKDRLGRSTPTSLATGSGDAVYWLNANLKEFGQLLPIPARSVGKNMLERAFDQFTGLCGAGQHGYFSFRAPDGTFHWVKMPAHDERVGKVPIPWTEAPVAMLAADGALVLVAPDRVFRIVRWASTSNASVLSTRLATGTPFAAGAQFVAVGEPARLLFVEPASRSWGRISESSVDGRRQFEIERVPLPEDGVPTGIAAARSGDAEVLYVTEAARDRIHRVRVADLKADTFQLKEGTRPSAIVPGPDGQVIFAATGGFGCITPVGDFRRIPLKAQVQPCLLAAGRPGSGKLFFTDRQAPGICSLNLAALAEPMGAGAGPAGLDFGEMFNGPSLLVGRLETKTQAQMERARKKRRAQKAKARAAEAAVARAEAAGAEPEEGKAGAAPETGVEARAESETGTGATVADVETGPGATEAAAESRPVAAVAESKVESKAEPKVESGDDSDRDAEEPGGAKGILLSRHIGRGAYQHVVDGHSHRKEPVLDGDGLAKSQFSEELTQTILGRFGTFKHYVLKVLRDGSYRDGHRPDRETLVLDLAMADPVGQVQAADGSGWLPTRLLRMAVGTEADGTTFCLKSIYPIPETRGDSKEGRSAGTR